MRTALLLALAALPLAAQGAAVPLDGTAWTATRIGARPASATRTPTLRFEGRGVQAHDGCNALRGTVTRTGDAIAIGTLAGTLMACPPGLENQASAFRNALQSAARTRLVTDRLILLTADDKELAEFRRESGVLAGTAWSLTMINNGRGAVASLLRGSSGSLAFDDAGRMTASAGCNTLRGTVTQSGETVRFGPVAATRKLCPAPDGMMAQERQLVAALGRATRVRIDGDRLELRDSTGALQLSARRAADGNAGAPQVLPPGPSGEGQGMGGELTYLADAALFRDCRSGARLPVAMEGAWRDVERAYLATRSAPGAPLYVVLDGAVQPRARMEGSGTQPTLVVSRHVGVFPSLRCERARGTASLVNTYWRLVHLDGRAITPVAGARREAHLILRERAGATEVSATVGCNGMGGRVTITGDRVEFGNLVGTMMACPEPLMSRERALADALARARTARVVAETMELRDESGATLALFESVYMR